MLYTRIVLSLAALMFATLGVLLVLRPDKLADWADISATSPSGRTELRAWYGGLELALAGLFVAGVFEARVTASAFLVLALASFGPLAGRLLGFVLDRSANGTGLSFAAIEVLFGVLGLVGYLRSVPPA
ncbi:MAG TPA: DUF4345 family protein [Planctomycetota bacterium]|nr:DUF4345 family protein [Planctomycetota bacterium]